MANQPLTPDEQPTLCGFPIVFTDRAPTIQGPITLASWNRIPLAEEKEPEPVTVVLVDTQTGRAVVVESEYSAQAWAEGNWSCDCNRELYFGLDSGAGTCLGHKRFLVVSASSDEYNLSEYNDEYDPDLIDCWLRRWKNGEVTNVEPVSSP